jgi:hypothetical protein
VCISHRYICVYKPQIHMCVTYTHICICGLCTHMYLWLMHTCICGLYTHLYVTDTHIFICGLYTHMINIELSARSLQVIQIFPHVTLKSTHCRPVLIKCGEVWYIPWYTSFCCLFIFFYFILQYLVCY